MRRNDAEAEGQKGANIEIVAYIPLITFGLSQTKWKLAKTVFLKDKVKFPPQKLKLLFL